MLVDDVHLCVLLLCRLLEVKRSAIWAGVIHLSACMERPDHHSSSSCVYAAISAAGFTCGPCGCFCSCKSESSTVCSEVIVRDHSSAGRRIARSLC